MYNAVQNMAVMSSWKDNIPKIFRWNSETYVNHEKL